MLEWKVRGEEGVEREEDEDVPEGMNPEFRKTMQVLLKDVTKQFKGEDHLRILPLLFSHLC